MLPAEPDSLAPRSAPFGRPTLGGGGRAAVASLVAAALLMDERPGRPAEPSRGAAVAAEARLGAGFAAAIERGFLATASLWLIASGAGVWVERRPQRRAKPWAGFDPLAVLDPKARRSPRWRRPGRAPAVGGRTGRGDPP